MINGDPVIRTGSLFSQILSLSQRSDFACHVRELKVEYRSKGFSSRDQFMAMLFCRLAQARSLQEITDELKSCEGRLMSLDSTTIELSASMFD